MVWVKFGSKQSSRCWPKGRVKKSGIATRGSAFIFNVAEYILEGQYKYGESHNGFIKWGISVSYSSSAMCRRSGEYVGSASSI